MIVARICSHLLSFVDLDGRMTGRRDGWTALCGSRMGGSMRLPKVLRGLILNAVNTFEGPQSRVDWQDWQD